MLTSCWLSERSFLSGLFLFSIWYFVLQLLLRLFTVIMSNKCLCYVLICYGFIPTINGVLNGLGF